MINSPSQGGRTRKAILAVLAIGVVLTIAIFGLSIAVLVKVNNGFESESVTSTQGATSITVTSTTAPQSPTLVASISINDVMAHLREFQSIADRSNGTRAVGTSGFNRTLDYIYATLNTNTNLNISRSFFDVRQFELQSDPILISSMDGREENYKYSETLSEAEFYFVRFSTSANFSSFIPVTVIPGVGCEDTDWRTANPALQGRVVLVKRGICLFSEKAALAIKYNVSALLLYNDGALPDRMEAIAVSLGQDQYLPALFLSHAVGERLAKAAANSSSKTGVRLIIDTKDLPLTAAGNICADTPTGDSTQTIVIGSHSDSVPAGPGINDNGVLGLLGSKDHVQRAKNATQVGERLRDYLINLNYDMLGSPNYIFGIYDGRTAKNDTPASALLGSNKITTAFRDWFQAQNLPWTHTDFSGRSDYEPFLVEGIVAGGLFIGADETKSMKERDEYAQILGSGQGGIADIIYDPCYHDACDSIHNINVFAYEKMVKAAAYMLEYLGQKENLSAWFYPTARS